MMKYLRGFIGVIGSFAWDEEHANELALECDYFVRLLRFYMDRELSSTRVNNLNNLKKYFCCFQSLR